MKAVVFKEHGSVDKLVYDDFEEPEIHPSEVIVKVNACGINHLDIWVREGLPGITIPLPHILGCEITGEIAGVGSAVKGLSTGQRVLIAPGINCGRCEYLKVRVWKCLNILAECIRESDNLFSAWQIWLGTKD